MKEIVVNIKGKNFLLKESAYENSDEYDAPYLPLQEELIITLRVKMEAVKKEFFKQCIREILGSIHYDMDFIGDLYGDKFRPRIIKLEKEVGKIMPNSDKNSEG